MKLRKQKLGLLCAALTLAVCQGCATMAQQPSPTPAARVSPSPPAVTEGTFQGISDAGDINEALKNAIDTAHEGLRVYKVEWRLEELSGVHGGWTPPRNRITVKIHARVGQP